MTRLSNRKNKYQKCSRGSLMRRALGCVLMSVFPGPWIIGLG